MSRMRSAAMVLSCAILTAGGAAAVLQQASGSSIPVADASVCRVDTVVLPWGELRYDTIAPDGSLISGYAWRKRGELMAREDSLSRYTTLTDSDYQVIAQELGVEVAAIKAVVRIEAGASLQGFYAPGVPVVNFDRAMYRRARATSNAKAPSSSHVPAGITSSYGRKEWSQLIAARKVNRETADMGTFWGMFKIGGFNYQQCGCASVQELVDRMCYSEFEQLQLFANFISNTGMLEDLRCKNWRAFARKYNGANYASRGYHTRMARAYAKYKQNETCGKEQSESQEILTETHENH